MENAQLKVNKGKKLKIFLSYVSLIILIVLLFLPMVFRIMVKDKKTVKKEVLTILNCDKSNENISSTFLDNIPQNILYSIKGNYLISNNPDEYYDDNEEGTYEAKEQNIADEEITNSSGVTIATPSPSSDNNEMVTTTPVPSNIKTINSPLFDKIKDLAEMDYDDKDDITLIRVSVERLKNTVDYEMIFMSIETQEEYYKSQGFSCTTYNP